AALLRRNLEYKVLATRSLFANTCSGIGAIIAAVHGEGVWTFVYQQLIYHSVSTFVLWKNETWRPKLFISFEYLQEMAVFSS
ncbi:oligosaccharide flippase family protein, partial [Acinetobacter baumannii]